MSDPLDDRPQAPDERRRIRPSLDPIRACVRAFPKSFRHRHGEDLVATTHRRCAETRQQAGRLAAFRVLLAECWNLVVCATRERARIRRSRPPSIRSQESTMIGTLGDLRFAVRGLARRPVFTLTVIATLTLGVGANTALFSIFDAVLLRPLPYPESERLVRVWPAQSTNPDGTSPFSVPDFEDWRSRTTSLSALGLYSTLPSDQVWTTSERAEELDTAYVTGGFFETLASPALLGRTLLAADFDEAADVVVLSHSLWRDRFGADPALVGATLTLEDRPYRVVGVMPPDFAFPESTTEIWVPLTVIPRSSIPIHLRPVRFLQAVGRLAPGVSIDAAREELSSLALALHEEYPDTNGSIDRARVTSLRETMIGDVRRSLLVLFVGVGILLLLGCVNVAHLLLARSAGRRREIAIRGALGAGRARLVRQLLTESLLLASIGGALGAVLAVLGVRSLVRLAGDLLPRASEVSVDARVLFFAVAVTLVTGVSFGLWPALRASRRVASARQHALQHALHASHSNRSLVAVEMAVALVLLVSAGLMVRTLDRLYRVDPGFEADGLLAVTLTISDTRYAERPRYLAFYREALEHFSHLPGVESVGSIRHLPLRGGGEEQIAYRLPDRPQPDPADVPSAQLLQVSAGTFRALGTPLLAGRAFDDRDREASRPVVVANEAFSREAFDGANPVGKTLLLSSAGDLEVEIVGWVGDIRQHSLREPATPTLYVPQELLPRRGMTFLLATDDDPLALAASARGVIQEMDEAQPVTEIVPMGQIVHDSVARPRFLTALLSGVALLALVLAAIGAYGVISQHTERRTAELGLRAALGARRGQLLGMVVRQGMEPVLVGLAVGVGLSLAATRWMGSLLFEIAPRDPVALGVSAVILALTAFAAVAVPAARAMRVDPVRALRVE